MYRITCIFLSCKAEDHYQDINYFVTKLEEFTQSVIKTDEILKLELIVLQGLQFHLLVYHPYRSLFAFVHDNDLISKLSEEVKSIDTLYNSGKLVIKQTLYTDASFLYPPGLIALASLYHGANENQTAVLGYVISITSRSNLIIIVTLKRNSERKRNKN